MGCWNETCLMSNLPIRGDSPVVAFLIAHDGFKDENKFSGTYYATDKVFPITLPIEATYDNYGCIQNYDESSLALKHIDKLFGSSLENIFEGIHEGNITIPSTLGNGNIGVGLVMFHKEIYQTAINKIAKLNSNSIRNQAIDSIEIALSSRKLKDDNIFEKYGLKPMPILDDFIGMSCSVDQSKKDEYALKVLKDVVVSKIDEQPENKDSILNSFADSIVERSAISLALNKLRKTWMPPSGKGSQSEFISAHIILANAIKKVAIAGKEPEELYRAFLTDLDY